MTMAATLCKITWLKVFKNGRSKICGRQPLKNLKEYGKARLRQILLGPFLVTLRLLDLLFGAELYVEPC